MINLFNGIEIPFEVKQMIYTAMSFIYEHATWILLVVCVLYIPVTYSLLLQLSQAAAKQNDIKTKPKKKGSSTGTRTKKTGTGTKKTGTGGKRKSTGTTRSRTGTNTGGSRKKTVAKRAIA